MKKQCRAQISAQFQSKKDKSKPNVVYKSLSDCLRNNITTKQILLNREFSSSIAVIHELKQDHHTFIMPARKISGIKNIIKQYVDENRKKYQSTEFIQVLIILNHSYL